MRSTVFLKPRLVGDRFEGHAIPLEFLKDLAVLEEMIVEVAKWRYLQDNPERKRSPRGFTDGIELVLTGVEEGSAIPVISLVVAAASLFPENNQAYFEHARDSIVNAIEAAENDSAITDHLPEKALGYFDRMGRSLRDGETMEFTTPSKRIARFTKETRRKLVLASSAFKEITEEISTRGSVPEADQDDMTFEVQLFDGRKVRAPIAPQHLDTIIEAFVGYKNGIRVLINGVGRFNRSETLQGFESIEHISTLEPLDVRARLEELSELQGGWLEGGGKVPSVENIEWLSRAFEEFFPDELPLPHIYPTEQGGVQAEWTLGTNEISVEVDFSNRTAVLHNLDMKSDSDDTQELDLTTSHDWNLLSDVLKAMDDGAA